MTATNFVSIATFYEETDGLGIGPSGEDSATPSTSADWEDAEAAGEAFQLPHIASTLSLDTLQHTMLTPEQVRTRLFQTQRRERGLSNVESLPLQTYLTGLGAPLDVDIVPPLTALVRVLRNALGGIHLVQTRPLAGGGHSTTTITVDDATTYRVGAVVAWEDPATGLCHPRQIVALAGNQATLDLELPSVPEDGQTIRGGVTIFIDEDVICDTSANLGSTLSGCLQKGRNGEPGFEVNGLKFALASMTFERNSFATLDFAGPAARFTTPPNGPSPTLPDRDQPDPLAIGPDTQIVLSNVGETELREVCNTTLSVEPGVPVVSQPCMGQHGPQEGVAFYTSEPADTTITVDVFPFSPGFFADFDDGQHKQVSVTRLGRSGSVASVRFPNAEIFNTPGRGGDSVATSSLTLRGLENALATSTDALSRSKFVIYLG